MKYVAGLRHFSSMAKVSSIAVILYGLLNVPAARGEIPNGPEVRIQAQFNKKLAAFSLKTSVDAYKANGMKDPKWDAKAVTFLEDFEKSALTLPEVKEILALHREGRDALLLGCKDPLVLYDCAVVANMLGNRAAAHFARDAADEMPKWKYPANRQAFAARLAYLYCNEAGDEADAKKYAEVMVRSVQAIFRDQTYGKDRELLADAMDDTTAGLPAEQIQALWMGVKDIPGADPVAVGLLEGDYHIAAAWEKRGSGWANTVTQEGWKGFADELQQARTVLTKTWELDKTIPQPAARMIPVAMGGFPDELRTWFDRSVAARMDFPRAYDDYLYAIYPRWCGNREMMMAFADECYATGRFDTCVPFRYVEILIAVRDQCDNGQTVKWSVPPIANKVQAIFARSVVPGAVHPGGHDYLLSMQACFDVQSGSFVDAATAVSQLEQGVDPRATARFNLTPAQLLELVKAAPPK